ncbi:zinc finger protein 91-like [Takifugu rubripes]|uniref:zinc finger protein 91-like n=1 Tax=Takifugu rubripes TaxID=31033 RepID=UPI00114532E9|nr:zinc finger protein 91-like [Takifugu rubripes]
MDTMKIEQVIVGNDVSSASVEIKSEPVVVPLQPSQDESLQCFQCLITFSDSKVKERHIKKFHEDQYKQHLKQCLNESISMDTVKIEPVTVGNEVSSTSVEIKPEPVVIPLQPSQDESLQCFQCLITFSNSKVKERHIKKFHGDQYKQHLQQKNTLFTCYRCDKCFFTSGELSQHQATHSREEKPFCCGYCRKEFCTFSELNKHRREECTECMERRCPCKDCGALFPNSERLLNHRIAMHPECLVVVRDMNAYQCSKCSQCFQTEDELVNHQEESACNVNHDVKLQGKKRGHNSKMMLMWRLLLTRKSRRSRGLESLQ